GDGANGQAALSLDELKRLPAAEVTAVCQCSGNRRGLFQPHVPGVEWGYGAMGCARWKGARLKDVLDKAGLKKEAVEIVFNGTDGPALDKTPDFIKSIPVWKAIEETTLVAYEMNGQPLPHWNGFPARVGNPPRHWRHRLGGRLRHPLGRGLDRRRQDLGRGHLGPGRRQVRVPHLDLSVHSTARAHQGDGARHQRDRPGPDGGFDPQ